MYWADRVAKEIIDSGKYKPYWVDDMKTLSGYPTVGSLRGPLVHDFIYKALTKIGVEGKFTYIFNDFDPMDEVPPELKEDFSKYLGLPLKKVPSPKKGYPNYADYFAADFGGVLRELGVEAEFLSSWDMYQNGDFDQVIKEALDNAEKIQDIYQKVSGSKKRELGWLPLQVICQKCGKLGTTRIHDWDGITVAYTCEESLVKWAQGCKHSDRVSPFGGNGKLPWKVDWPAHWKVLGITIEGAGKDHSSAGGSRDIANALCKEVFHTEPPYNLPYEFFLLGGRKMSTSKGIGLKARELKEILPLSVARFLFCRTDYRQTVEFDPVETMAISDLFDEYDRCYESWIENSGEDFARIFEMSLIGDPPPREKTLLPRFRDIVSYIQMPNVNVLKKYEEIKGGGLSETEKNILNERVKYAKIWLEEYAPDEFKLQISEALPEKVKELTSEQKEFLGKAVQFIEENDDPEKLQLALYNLTKELKFDAKKSFSAIYIVLTGKEFGPKAAWFILQYPKKEIIARIKKAIKGDSAKEIEIKKLNKPGIFSIHPELKQRFATISIGIAVIKGVKIKKMDHQLEQENKDLLSNLSLLTTEQIGQFPEVISYRRMYKEMGIDWHSRRPSPEALLRRIALNKGLYNINTCVDAYNLVVMRNKVSVGAFDFDQIKFPTVLRFAEKGEKILLLGDDKPTEYKESEVAYFDKEGGFNIDFNFRDAQRTAVQLQTKDLYINVDGIYDITPQMVEKVLKETCDVIVKYCGGEVVEFGVETA